MTRANSRLTEAIASFGLQVEIRLDDCSPAWPIESLQDWSDKSLAYRVTLGDLTAVSVIALPNPLAQIMIGTLLGEQIAEWPAERDLTPGEESVGELFVSNVATSINDAWPGDEAIRLHVAERDPSLRRTRIFKFREPFIVCRSTIRTEIGSAAWSWMLPHEFLSRLFGTVRMVPPAPGETARQQLETLARDMSTQVTIRLGGVQLSAPQLAALRVGDLVVLNQKVSEPLRAMVSGKPRFLGWPGRVGNRQAFELSSEGPRQNRPADVGATTEPAASQ